MTENIKNLASYLNIEESQIPKHRRMDQVIRRLLMWLLTDIRNGILYLVDPGSLYEKIIKKANRILEDYPADEEKWDKIKAEAQLLADATLQVVGSDFSAWTKLSNLTADSRDGWSIELKKMGIAAMHAGSAWIVIEIARGDVVKAVDAACWTAFNAACAGMVGKADEKEIAKFGVAAFQKYKEIVARKLIRLIDSSPRESRSSG